MSDGGRAFGRGPEWLYPGAGDEVPPRGEKLYLLTKGHVAVTGVWRNDGSFIAWQHLHKRNKEKESKLNGQ